MQPSGSSNFGYGAGGFGSPLPLIRRPSKTLWSVPLKTGIALGGLHFLDRYPSARRANGLLGVRNLLLGSSLRLGLMGGGIALGACLGVMTFDRYRKYRWEQSSLAKN